MSMLTPPGMGGKYRITGHRFPHMRRRPRSPRRIVLAAAVTVAVLGLGGWGTAQLVDVFSGGSGGGSNRAAQRTGDCDRASGGDHADARAAGHAAPHDDPLPRPGDITVNVYNATPRSRLAQTTADELRQRGFKIGKVGNAPSQYDKKVTGTALLLGSPEAADGPVKVLSEQFGGAEVKSDVRKGEDVDLIIGTGFKELAPQQGGGQPPASPSPSATASRC